MTNNPLQARADMEARLAAAQTELDRRREAVELQQRLRDELVVEAIDVHGFHRTEVAKLIGLSESAVRKALVAA